MFLNKSFLNLSKGRIFLNTNIFKFFYEFISMAKQNLLQQQIQEKLNIVDEINIKFKDVKQITHNYSSEISYKGGSVLRELGIDPVLKKIVDHPKLHKHTENVVYTEGYNSKYYILIKGRKGEEKLHKNGGDYYFDVITIAEHENSPALGFEKVHTLINLLDSLNNYKFLFSFEAI